MSGVYGGARLLRSLEERVLPREVCEPLDRFLAAVPGAPEGYSKDFANFLASNDVEAAGDRAWLTAYKRWDGR